MWHRELRRCRADLVANLIPCATHLLRLCINIEQDLEQFHRDDIVRQALRDGVDLRGYARDIQMELREVRDLHRRLGRYILILYVVHRQR